MNRISQKRWSFFFRRAFFSAAILFPGLIFAADSCQLTIARLKYEGGGDWYADPSSLPNLVKAVRERTGLPVCDTIATIEIVNDRLFRFPFLYMTGHGDVHFTQKERLRLRKYLLGGGFLWADDCYGMDKTFRKEIAVMFPENPLVEVGAGHPIYKSKYTLPGLPKIHEHDGGRAKGLGIFFDRRLVLFYSFDSDIGDGMEDEEVHHDGEQLHETALRMGVNIVAWFFQPKNVP